MELLLFLPPVESLAIDFSNFLSLAKSADIVADTKGTNNSNWEFAALVTGYWRVIISTTLAIPVSAFKLALDQDPEFVSDKTWQWSYTVTPADITYKARLTGQIGASDVTWKMYVTREGADGFTDFLWLEGTSKIDGTGGEWTLHQSAAVPGAILQIVWTKTGTSIGSVKYTYVKADSFQNSYIDYALKTTALKCCFHDSLLQRDQIF